MVRLPKLRLYWDSIRPRESLMMLGVPTLGILFAKPRLDVQLLQRTSVLLFCGLLVAGHLYTLNDLFGLGTDVYDRHKRERPLQGRKVRAAELWAVSVALGVCGYGLVFWLDAGLFWFSFSLTLLWLLYSLPRGLKGYPVVTSAVNSIGAGMIPFLIGYRLVAPFSLFALGLSLYFGVIAGAGQMNREILDLEADRAAGLRTTAVWLGPRRTFAASYALFVLSAVYLLGAVLRLRQLPLGLGIAALLAQPVHYWAYRTCLRSGLDNRDAVITYIQRYRDLYAVLGVVYTALLVWRQWP